MVLRKDDFVAWRINWKDKAQNILEIAQELNLGLQSVVFLDDNPVERARVREAHPEVLVPHWPEDKLLYKSAFLSLTCFDTAAITAEDAERTAQYTSERKREALQKQTGSLDDWLKGLQIKVKAEPLNPANLQRTIQLLNKTNQLNLTTRRLNEAEMLEWTRTHNRALYAVSVSDRFGDAGLTGIVSVELDGEKGTLVDYVLSCRVMGRKVEHTLVHIAVEELRKRGATTVEARLVTTAKNKPCLTFWASESGFDRPADNHFTWDASRPYPLPDAITLELAR
jgi:FkbH-like protein